MLVLPSVMMGAGAVLVPTGRVVANSPPKWPLPPGITGKHLRALWPRNRSIWRRRLIGRMRLAVLRGRLQAGDAPVIGATGPDADMTFRNRLPTGDRDRWTRAFRDKGAVGDRR
jgi:hypothetical protein